VDRLIEVIYEQGDCQLLTPPGTITYPTNQGGTTIDLAFGSSELVDSLIECQVATELDYGSDHLPIRLRFQIETLKGIAKKRRCWKKYDIDRAKTCLEDLDYSRQINSTEELELYARYLSNRLVDALDQSVPWKRVSKYANPWWTPQVATAVKEARAARKEWLDSRSEEARLRATELGKVKAKVVANAKRESYRQLVDDTTQGDGLWKLSRWSRGSDGDLPQVPTLRSNQQVAKDFDSKVTLLKERFFPTTQADLSDISS